jgi:CspA family cold shock protein
MPTGRVRHFDAKRAFGFIKPDVPGLDVFVHVTGLRGVMVLVPGDLVSYGVRENPRRKGKLEATDVTIISSSLADRVLERYGGE